MDTKELYTNKLTFYLNMTMLRDLQNVINDIIIRDHIEFTIFTVMRCVDGGGDVLDKFST